MIVLVSLIVLLRGFPCFQDFSHGPSHPYIIDNREGGGIGNGRRMLDTVMYIFIRIIWHVANVHA